MTVEKWELAPQGLGQSVKDRKQTAHQNICLLLNNFANVQITETMR
jgi:hypothetical protein